MTTRRQFLAALAGPLVAPAFVRSAPKAKLAGEVGITTSSFSSHLVPRPAKGKITLLELPKILRDELDMRVIDLNTSSLASFEPAYLDAVRKAADDAGCILTNLKLNQRGLDMSSPDKAVRDKAFAEYERSLDAASRLGLRWARPLPLRERSDWKLHVAAYRRLAEYGDKKGLQMLVENYGWMEAEADSVVKLIKAVGGNVAASPDTGNWKDNTVRYAGLARTFPLAVTCDFKARKLGPEGEHELYDLKKCFTIGWGAGFRGPWCLEHANPSRATLFKELALLRDRLRSWMKEA